MIERASPRAQREAEKRKNTRKQAYWAETVLSFREAAEPKSLRLCQKKATRPTNNIDYKRVGQVTWLLFFGLDDFNASGGQVWTTPTLMQVIWDWITAALRFIAGYILVCFLPPSTPISSFWHVSLLWTAQLQTLKNVRIKIKIIIKLNMSIVVIAYKKYLVLTF